MGTKRFTILHSNDIHGDFLAEDHRTTGREVGGLSLLSGYINQVRRQEKNVLYLNAGDMVQGSVIDAEFKGVSTMELMNYLAPDVATLGNHELDYGLSHLLFLERMANFPIVNANLYLKKYHKRLMRPYLVLKLDGFDILFIGIITEQILEKLKSDDIGTFVRLEDAAAEVGRICNAFKDSDIDLTVLLTHIGYDSDKELAALLNPAWGVDMIIGGHSHTFLAQPDVVNGILIAHAGTGSNQIGRFDLVVDDETNRIVEWKWQLVPIDTHTSEPDDDLDLYIASLKEVVDRKYSRLLCRLADKLVHPRREEETPLGNLISDILAQRARVDVMLVGSGSIRGTELGPLVTLGHLREVYPYDGALYRVTVTGAQLRRTFAHIMRSENRNGEGNCFQVNRGVQAVYQEAAGRLASLTVQGQPVADERRYTIGLQEYHYRNADTILNLPEAEMTALAPVQTVATSDRDILEEHMSSNHALHSQVEGRLIYR